MNIKLFIRCLLVGFGFIFPSLVWSDVYIVPPPGVTIYQHCRDFRDSLISGLPSGSYQVDSACVAAPVVGTGICHFVNTDLPSFPIKDRFKGLGVCSTTSGFTLNEKYIFRSSCPSGMSLGGDGVCIDDTPHNCDEKTGQDAGIVENSPTRPGYDLLCFDNCAVEVSEYFQRIDNDHWVVAYRYTGQPCGPGDPLGEPDVPPGEEGPPAINPNTPPDTDGDGIPDDNDDDIDGDGIPNSLDDDKDGDGIPDDDDPSPAGPPQQQQTSAANVALDCRQSVACSGDAIQCAQLVELHRLRCAGNLSSQDITDMVGQLEGWGDEMLDEAINSQIDGLENGISEFDDIAEGPVSTFGEMIKGFLPQPVSCSVYVVEFPWPVGTKSFDCEMFDTFKLIYGWFLSILVLIYCWHMAIQPVNR